MPTIQELDDRLTFIEELLKVHQLKKEFYKTTIRYVILSEDNTKILSNNGFKLVNRNESYNIKLFANLTRAREAIEESEEYKNFKVRYKRVRVTYELLEGGDVDE